MIITADQKGKCVKDRPCHHLLGILLLVTSVAAAAHEKAEGSPLAIEGYSPVSYFERGQAERGRAEFSAVYNGFRYHFTDADQVATFKANPARFEPLFTEHCPYSLTLGRAVAIDPESFKIVGGHLLLFHRSDEMDGRQKWNQADDEHALLEQARSQYTLFRF